MAASTTKNTAQIIAIITTVGIKILHVVTDPEVAAVNKFVYYYIIIIPKMNDIIKHYNINTIL